MRNLSLACLLLVATTAFSQNTFTTIYNTLQSKCVSCHSGGTPAGALNLSGTETQVYNAIVEVAPTNATAAAKGDKLIDKGYPERSFLLRKVAHVLSDDLALTSGEGLDEPNTQAKLADQDIELIRQWILQAAPQTGNVVSYQRLVDYYTIGGEPKIAKPAAPPPGQGYQIHLGPVFWAPGQENEFFKKYNPRFTQALDVYRFEIVINSESHHFILRKFQPGTESNWSDGIEPFSLNAFDSDKDFVNAWQRSADLELPVGTAFFWDQTTVLDLNYHMLNPHSASLSPPLSPSPPETGILPGECYINIYTRPHSPSTVEMKAELIPYPYLYIAPGQTISFSDDITRNGLNWNIWMLASHTHKYGTDYDVYQRNANGSQGTKLYEGFYDFEYTFNQGYYDWSHPAVRHFSPMYTVNMSNGLIQKATYHNTGPSTITWSFQTTGEMMLVYVQYTTQSVAYKPLVRINGNTSGCNPVELRTDGGLSSYRWSNGETTQNVTVSSSGIYTVTVTDGSGVTYSSDPVTVNINAASVNLNDVSACQGDVITLDAGNAATSYLWSTGATSQAISPAASGSYAVTITNSNGCTASDVANVTVHQLPVVDISDISICTGSSATFDAGNPGLSYLWNTGATTQTITVSQQGNYSVTVTSGGNCASSDQAMLTAGTNLIFDLQDKSLCDGTNTILDAGFPGSNYLWSTGDTSQSITVSSGGPYSVTVTDHTGCNGSDNATVTVVQNPVADAGEDKTLCPGSTIDLTATGGAVYTWSSGQQGSTITVDAEGSYNVTVTDANGCTATDKTDVEEAVILTGNIAGDDDVEVYSTVSYTVNDNSGSSYQWTVTNGTIVTGQGGHAVDVNWETAGLGTLEVVETTAGGCAGAKVSFDVNVGEVGIRDVADGDIFIYPNPFTETSRIVFPEPINNATLSIYDVTGKVVYFNPSVSGTEIALSREGFSGGIYFAELRGNDKVFRGKMVVGE